MNMEKQRANLVKSLRSKPVFYTGQFLERSESRYFPQLKDKEVNVSMAAPLIERDGVLKKRDFISVRQLAVQKLLANRWRRNCITGQRFNLSGGQLNYPEAVLEETLNKSQERAERQSTMEVEISDAEKLEQLQKEFDDFRDVAHKLNLENIRQRRKVEDQWNEEKIMKAELNRQLEEKDVQLEETRRQLAAAVALNEMWDKGVGKIV